MLNQPKFIFYKILFDLSLSDIDNLSLTCKKMYMKINKDDLFYKLWLDQRNPNLIKPDNQSYRKWLKNYQTLYIKGSVLFYGVREIFDAMCGFFFVSLDYKLYYYNSDVKFMFNDVVSIYIDNHNTIILKPNGDLYRNGQWVARHIKKFSCKLDTINFFNQGQITPFNYQVENVKKIIDYKDYAFILKYDGRLRFHCRQTNEKTKVEIDNIIDINIINNKLMILDSYSNVWILTNNLKTHELWSNNIKSIKCGLIDIYNKPVGWINRTLYNITGYSSNMNYFMAR